MKGAAEPPKPGVPTQGVQLGTPRSEPAKRHSTDSRAPADHINKRILPRDPCSIVWYSIVWYNIVETEASYQPWCLVSPLYWALEPECQILLFMWSFGPLTKEDPGSLELSGHSRSECSCVALPSRRPQSPSLSGPTRVLGAFPRASKPSGIWGFPKTGDPFWKSPQ